MEFSTGVRNISFRYVAARNGVEYAELKAVGTPTITMIASGEIKTSLRGVFVVPSGVDLITDRIRPHMSINGTEYQLGEFVAGSADEEYSGGVSHVELEAYDLGSKVKNAYLSSSLYKSQGIYYLDVIKEQLLLSGIERVIADPCTDILASQREDWEIGTSRIKVINDLLSEINYRSLWFDNQGNARLSKYMPPSVENATHFYKADEYSIIAENSNKSTDMYGAYNDFIAVVSSPDYPEPMVATATNDNPVSALSVQRIGRRTAPVIRLNNIASATALQEYVDNIKAKSMLTTELCRFTTALMPHQVGDVIVLDHPHLQGVCEETEWTMPLEAGGEMMHKGKRVMYL